MEPATLLQSWEDRWILTGCPNTPLTLQLKLLVLNILCSQGFSEHYSRSRVRGFFEPFEPAKLVLNQHYFRTMLHAHHITSRLHNGARWIRILLDTSSDIETQRTAGSTKLTYQIRVEACFMDENEVTGIDAVEGPIEWALCVQFDLNKGGSSSWGSNHVIELLHDALKGGFAKDGSPTGGEERKVPHDIVGALWITMDEIRPPLSISELMAQQKKHPSPTKTE